MLPTSKLIGIKFFSAKYFGLGYEYIGDVLEFYYKLGKGVREEGLSPTLELRFREISWECMDFILKVSFSSGNCSGSNCTSFLTDFLYLDPLSIALEGSSSASERSLPPTSIVSCLIFWADLESSLD